MGRAAFVGLVLMLLSGPARAGDCDLVGHWEGNLTHEGQHFPILLDISCQDHHRTITLDLPEYLIYGSDVEVVEKNDWLEVRPRMLSKANLKLRKVDGRLVGQCKGFSGVTAEVAIHRVDQDPMLYLEDDVSFASGDGQLEGTLLTPAGDGPFPTIVWTHGSGRDTRDTFYYSGRAHLMAQNGVASLIYDKRGSGESTGTRAYDLNVLIDDALVAVESIKSRADVDGAAIGIAGFSQGGWIAPAVAARDADIDFVLVGATPGVSGGEQNIFSMASRMRRDGESDESVAAAERFVTLLYGFYETGEDRDTVAAALEEAERESWFDSKWVQNVLFIPDDGLPAGARAFWAPFARDPMDTWRKVRVPVLSMWGANDMDVPVELSRLRLEETFAETGNNDVLLVVFPGASHGMWVEKQDSASWDWPRQVLEAQELMVSWVRQQSGISGRRP